MMSEELPPDETPGDEIEALAEAEKSSPNDASPFAHLTPLQRAHLAAYSHTGNLARAAKIVRMCRYNHYRWMEDPQYRAAFAMAQEMAGDTLESEAVRRAMDGWDEPVYRNDGCVGSVRKYSDRLLELLLRGVKPAKFGTKIEHAGRIDGQGSSVVLFLPDNGRSPDPDAADVPAIPDEGEPPEPDSIPS